MMMEKSLRSTSNRTTHSSCWYLNYFWGVEGGSHYHDSASASKLRLQAHAIVLSFYFLFYFLARSQHVAQANLKLAILLPQPPKWLRLQAHTTTFSI